MKEKSLRRDLDVFRASHNGISEDDLLALLGKWTGAGDPGLTPIVKPAVVDTLGNLTLYADGSIGSGLIAAYAAEFKGPGNPYYGFVFRDSETVFPQIKDDPNMHGLVAASKAALWDIGKLGGAASAFGAVAQGRFATPNPDGGFLNDGKAHAVRGVAAVNANTADIPALIETWRKAGYYPIQVEQGAGVTNPDLIHFGAGGVI